VAIEVQTEESHGQRSDSVCSESAESDGRRRWSEAAVMVMDPKMVFDSRRWQSKVVEVMGTNFTDDIDKYF
jgi:hypothetical protein